MAYKNRKKRTYDWFTNKYQLVIRNEENFEETRSVTFNYAKAFSFLFILMVVLLFTSLFLAKFVLAQWYDPEYGERKLKRQMVAIATDIDSLAYELQRRDNLILVLKTMLDGGQVLEETDSVVTPANHNHAHDDTSLSEVDVRFRAQFETEGKDKQAVHSHEGNVDVMEFFPPLQVPLVVKKFNPAEGHFGVDLASEPESTVKSIADGTVLISTYTKENGNVVAIQHGSDLISVYKHNAVVFKKAGSLVRAGEVVAIIGNSGENTTGSHLHFEMWLEGRAVDPEEYIAF